MEMALDDIIKENRVRNLRRRYGRRGRFTSSRYRSNTEPKVDNRRRLRVENLNRQLNNQELRKLFEEYGALTRCGIKFDKLGLSTGVAHVEFSQHEDAEKAKDALNNASIEGGKITVDYAKVSRNFRFVRRRSLNRDLIRSNRRRPQSQRLRRRPTRFRRSSDRGRNSGRRRIRGDRDDRRRRQRGTSNRNSRNNNGRRRLFKNSLGRRRPIRRN